MSSPPGNQGESPVDEQEPGTPPNEDEESSSDEGTGTDSPATGGRDTHTPHGPRRAPLVHQRGASTQASCNSCRPRCFGQCPQRGSQPVNLNALFQARLKATGKELERIEFILKFVKWVSQSNFLRFQQPEPIVGGAPGTMNEPRACPESLEDQGIRGQSIYTVLFNHVDMGTFTCKICGHIVNDELEAAIIHQRVVHFDHYPYRCTQAQCAPFASHADLEGHQHATGH